MNTVPLNITDTILNIATMSVTASEKIECEAIEKKHKLAARKLIQEVIRDHVILVRGKLKLEYLFEKWAECMKVLRCLEKRMIETGIPEGELKSHGELVEVMIGFSGAISLFARRHLEKNYQLEESERASLSSQIDLVDRHRKILEFEFKGWHGPHSRKELEALAQRFSGVSDRKAA
jgi:hypothetical protein